MSKARISRIVHEISRSFVADHYPNELAYIPIVCDRIDRIEDELVDGLMRRSPSAGRSSRPLTGLKFADQLLYSPSVVLIVRALVREAIVRGHTPSAAEIRDAIDCAANALGAPAALVMELRDWAPDHIWSSLEHELTAALQHQESSQIGDGARAGQVWVFLSRIGATGNERAGFMSSIAAEQLIQENRDHLQLFVDEGRNTIQVVRQETYSTDPTRWSPMERWFFGQVLEALTTAERRLPFSRLAQAIYDDEMADTAFEIKRWKQAVLRTKSSLDQHLSGFLSDVLGPCSGESAYLIRQSMSFCWIRPRKDESLFFPASPK